MQLTKFFSVKGMLKRHQIIGDLPSSRTAYSNFFRIAWPSALEALLVALVGAIDTIMVGTLGEGAIAAVGITTQPKFILLALIFSLNTGITAVAARRKGQDNRRDANRTVRTGIIFSAVSSILMAFLGFLFAKPILLFAGAESSYLNYALDYFDVILLSLPFQALNLTINAAQRGCGKTKVSMYSNIISNLINIPFNFLLINGIGIFPKLEVRGAAIATLMGAIAAFLISFSTLLRSKGYLSFHVKAGWAIHRDVTDAIIKVSSSAFVEQVFMRIGFLAYAAIIARLGTTQYATHLICMNILTLSFCFGDGLSIAASALVGQNLGAKRPDLSIVYGKTGQRLAFLISCGIFLVFLFGRTFLVSLFSDEAAIITLGANIMILAALGTHFQTSQVVLSGCLRGAGDTAYVAGTSFLSVALIRPLLTFLLCYPAGLGVYGAWVALLIDQAFRFASSYHRFSSGRWTKIIL
ncbi:putative MATE family efflux protein [Anaerotaenia torta]|uniref:MATE family efflux transporter n=1 Tax=Anaerotaenia torta TaxID=433293 RepID=UPI003D1F6A2A